MVKQPRLPCYFKLTLLFLSIFSTPVFAIEVSALYTSEVAVVDQSEANRQVAVRQGLQAVLSKMSGEPTLSELPFVQEALDNAELYVREYNYQQQKYFGEDILLLRVLFDKDSINQLLRDNNKIVWGKNRPLVLLWLAVDKEKHRELVSAEQEDPIVSNIQAYANMRGLPLILPMLDMDEMIKVSVNDVWELRPGPVVAASKRYSSDAILLGRIRQVKKDDWQAEWLLVQGKDKRVLASNGDSLDHTLQAGINDIVSDIAKEYTAPTSADASRVTLTITGIQAASDFAQTSDYLNDLASVEKASLISASPSTVTYDVRLITDKESLQQTLSLGRRLQKINMSSKKVGRDHLYYRWIQ